MYLNDTRHFVLKIYETIRSGTQTDYLNTQILFGVPKNRIPNTNTTIRSNYLNSNWIPNYSSHHERGLTRQEIGKMSTRWRAVCYCGVAGPGVLVTIWPARLAMCWRHGESESIVRLPESRKQRPGHCRLCLAPGPRGSVKFKPMFPLYTTGSFSLYI